MHCRHERRRTGSLRNGTYKTGEIWGRRRKAEEAWLCYCREPPDMPQVPQADDAGDLVHRCRGTTILVLHGVQVKGSGERLEAGGVGSTLETDRFPD